MKHFVKWYIINYLQLTKDSTHAQMSMVTLLDLRMMVSPLTGLVSLLCLAPAVTISPGDSSDCGVFGWAVPEPPSGAKLMQVHAIIRSIVV